MTIVEAMKLRKRLAVKSSDLRKKIAEHCAIMDVTTPLYPDQKVVVSGWLQAHRDIVKLMEQLSVSIQRTNLSTDVTIVLGGKEITKTVAAWVVRRRELAPMDLSAWQLLTDRGLKEQPYTTPDNKTEIKVAKILRFFDPKERDEMVDLFSNEPSRIDAKLETVNATIQLVENVIIDEDALLK